MSKLLMVSLRNGEIGADVAHAEYNDVLKATKMDQTAIELCHISDEHAQLKSLDSVEGVIVGGCSLNVSDAHTSAWAQHVDAVLTEVVESGKPVFFVCFGTSWLVHYLGGNIVHTHPEDSGPTQVSLSDAGKRDVLLQGFPGNFTALTGHTENPDESTLPPSLEILAVGNSCPVQMIRYGDHVWATQFHAEMDAKAMQTRMDFFANHGYFSPEDYDKIVKGLPLHDVSWANRILQSFTQYCVG